MELWKAWRETTETVDATLPENDQQPRVHHRHAGGQFSVYQPFHREGRPYLGRAAVELGPEEMTPPPDRWKAALAQAAAVPDGWYPLKLESELPPVMTSTLEKQQLERWVEPMDEVISHTLKEEPVLPLREHLKFTRTFVQYRDSFGRELEEARYTGSLEVFLVPQSAPEAHPFSAELNFSEFAPEVVAGFLRDQARLACDAYEARTWEPEGEFQVLLRGRALAAVFDFALASLGAPAVAAGVSKATRGEALWGPSVEGLTLTALPRLYNSPLPGTFDEEGIVLSSRTLLADGVVEGLWSTQATAHWLGVPLTGRPRNYSVSPGTMTWGSLVGRRVLEVHRLRWAEVEPDGTFMAEVGLADLHEAGGKRPVFGFTVGGRLSDLLTKGRFSSDVGVWEHVEGPEFLVVDSAVLRS